MIREARGIVPELSISMVRQALGAMAPEVDRRFTEALRKAGLEENEETRRHGDRWMIETELDVLRDVSQRLDANGIAFMLTGSLAMNYYAQPRMTRDIDLVVALNEKHKDTFVRLFETEYYLDRQTVAHAIARRSMFNLIHNRSIIKVDCVVLKTDPYRQEEFARRSRVSFGDFATWIVSREDLILSKLFWAKDSKSEMQLRDVRNLLTDDVDMEYLRSHATTLEVSDLLEKVLTADE